MSAQSRLPLAAWRACAADKDPARGDAAQGSARNLPGTGSVRFALDSGVITVEGARIQVAEITAADADRWRKAISEKGDRRKPHAAATIAKRVHVVKCIFSRARRWKLVPENPFEHLRAGPQSNPDRAFYVRPEVVQRIIDGCPCPQWKAIIALSRFAGCAAPPRSSSSAGATSTGSAA